jgi:hypothetical protein
VWSEQRIELMAQFLREIFLTALKMTCDYRQLRLQAENVTFLPQIKTLIIRRPYTHMHCRHLINFLFFN